jgi:hypothetical protein
MPGFVLHAGALVICMHAGQAQPTSMNPRVLVSGQPIVTQASVYSIVGCGLTGTPNPPCVTAQWISAALRVRAGGVPVLLQDCQAICAPTGTGLNATATQIRVRGI